MRVGTIQSKSTWCPLVEALSDYEEDGRFADLPNLVSVSDDSDYMDDVDDLYSNVIATGTSDNNCAMTEVGDEPLQAKHVASRARVSTCSVARPTRQGRDNRCLVGMVIINGHQALTLFDSGSTSDSIAPEFARVTNLKVYPLLNPVNLQLGTVGSRSHINYGAFTSVKYASISAEKEYVDVVNIDRYDAVLGTVFMRKYGISLDFEKGVVCIRGTPAPTLSEGEETQEMARRHSLRRSGAARE